MTSKDVENVPACLTKLLITFAMCTFYHAKFYIKVYGFSVTYALYRGKDLETFVSISSSKKLRINGPSSDVMHQIKLIALSLI